jgi:hypothetical protein
LAQAFYVNLKSSIGEVRGVVAEKCHGLENYIVDSKGLRAFIMRLTKSSGDGAAWAENVLIFLGH